ncbi:MAG: hypothetical protein ACKO3W_05595 [bacterium]
MSHKEKQSDDEGALGAPTGVPMHRDWAWLCIAWRAFLTGKCVRSPSLPDSDCRSRSRAGLRPEAWVVLHLDDGVYIVEWVDGEALARAHRVRDGSMPEPTGIGPIDINHPPSLHFAGISIARPPRVPLEGSFSVCYGPLCARAGYVTVRLIAGRFRFEEDATIVS